MACWAVRAAFCGSQDDSDDEALAQALQYQPLLEQPEIPAPLQLQHKQPPPTEVELQPLEQMDVSAAVGAIETAVNIERSCCETSAAVEPTVGIRFERIGGESMGPLLDVPLAATLSQLQQLVKRAVGRGSCGFRVVGGTDVMTTLNDAICGVSTERTLRITCIDLEPRHEDFQSAAGFDRAGFTKANATWRKQKSRMLASTAAHMVGVPSAGSFVRDKVRSTAAAKPAPASLLSAVQAVKLTPTGLPQLPRRPEPVVDPQKDAQRQAQFKERYALVKE